MAVLSRTWNILVGECDRLTMSGIDLTFEINRLLASSLRTALETNFTNIFESIRLRTQVSYVIFGNFLKFEFSGRKMAAFSTGN
jgi:hypothetical protein